MATKTAPRKAVTIDLEKVSALAEEKLNWRPECTEYFLEDQMALNVAKQRVISVADLPRHCERLGWHANITRYYPAGPELDGLLTGKGISAQTPILHPSGPQAHPVGGWLVREVASLSTEDSGGTVWPNRIVEVKEADLKPKKPVSAQLGDYTVREVAVLNEEQRDGSVISYRFVKVTPVG